ncbi:MAG: hypothetical protein ACK5LL_03550 [Suipraeoptans sp.]
MKIHAAYYKNAEQYFADRSVVVFRQGKMNAADKYCQMSAEYTIYLRWMLHYYNKIMCAGKWDDILTPEIAPPPNMYMYLLTKSSLKIGEKKLFVTLWQGAKECKELIFSRYGRSVKWIEIANLGRGSLSYELICDNWIKLSEIKGEVETEARITVEIVEIERHFGERGKIKIKDSVGNITEISVLVQERKDVHMFSDQTFLEAEGYVAMAAVDYEEVANNTKESYSRIVPHLGRHEGAGLEAYSPQLNDLGVENLGTHPFVKYFFSLETSGSHLLELYRLPTLNSFGKIRMGVQVDKEPIQILESEVTDEHRGEWRNAVKNEVDKLMLNLPYLGIGKHNLKIIMIDSYILLSKLVIYTKGYGFTSLGPELSIRVFEILERRWALAPIPDN